MKKLAAFVVLAVLAVGAGYWFATRIPASPFDSVGSATAPLPVERGEYAARLADCVACHSTEGGKAFTGGLAMGTPLGTIFSTNITPDRETGIGGYTLAQFDNAVRRGVAPDGRRLYPAMPHPSYAKMSDDDVRALYDYFLHHVPAVRQENRPTTIAWPLNMRWPLAFWNLAFADAGSYRPAPAHDEIWNRGAYLVQGPGHCGSCHTPRGLALQEVALDERDPRFLSGALLDGWYAPSLRNDHNTGLGRWSEEDVATFLKDGRNQHGVVFGSMMEAFNNSTQFMTDGDLAAIARYLKSLPGDAARDGAPWSYQAAAAPAPAGPMASGARIYAARCGFCHGSDGRGRNEWISPLAGASSVLALENASVINITLNGSGRVVAAGVPDAYRMPALRDQLSDGEIADVLTFIRGSWGNRAASVTAEEVRTLRELTNAASSDPIVLQMR
ncbi:cytochrome c [Ancylobacter sonchi]|uniref:c-type cytochrome n=1 Tax=Ancylobacter sonchi TaxID=1937790 RepID=UPI001BD3D475|nr:cytochrome c [Ancylobacter sonchi]MBS7534734.1 cytochrome c [Ancylobacter sonchi]